MAKIEFRQRDLIASMMQTTTEVMEDFSINVGDTCMFILMAMPVPVQAGDEPAFLITTNGPKDDLPEILELVKARLERRLEEMRRMN